MILTKLITSIILFYFIVSIMEERSKGNKGDNESQACQKFKLYKKRT